MTEDEYIKIFNKSILIYNNLDKNNQIIYNV
jgi:hypothetical protein